MKALAVAILITTASAATAQVARNGPEWDGKDHQPTQTEVTRREDRAGVEPSPAQAGQDKRTVQQLDQQLLHEEVVDPPRDPDPSLVVSPSGKQ